MAAAAASFRKVGSWRPLPLDKKPAVIVKNNESFALLQPFICSASPLSGADALQEEIFHSEMKRIMD